MTVRSTHFHVKVFAISSSQGFWEALLLQLYFYLQVTQEILGLAAEENISMTMSPNLTMDNSLEHTVFEEAEEVSETAASLSYLPNSITREEKRKRKGSDERLLEMVVSKLSSIEGETEDISEVFGRHVGMEIKNMDNLNACIAKRLINEVLFYGSLGHLKMTASVKSE